MENLIVKLKSAVFLLIVGVGLSTVLGGCDGMTNQQQRIASGGALGAAAGIGITAATGGGNLLVGAVAGGAAIGALTK